MSLRYAIALQVDVRTGLERAPLLRMARRALSREEVATGTALSIVLTDDAAIRALNHRYRGINSPTDVLSFAQLEGHALVSSTRTPRHLGDVVISMQTARRQAREHRIAISDEVAHLLVHGILHLLGYDHRRPREAATMRAREDAILGVRHHH